MIRPMTQGKCLKLSKLGEASILKGCHTLVKKDPTAYAPYTQWILKKNEDRCWPFAIQSPLYPQEYEVPDIVPKGDFELLRVQNWRLLEENETLKVRHHMITQENNQLTHEL